MSHTPIGRWIRSITTLAAEADSRGIDPRQLIGEKTERPMSRRDFIGRAAAGSAALALSPWAFAGKPTPASGRVVIVGAGLAGLTCAYRLGQAGINATIYEANSRLGGRCWSRRGEFADGQVAEHGGELIDQSHSSIRQLAQELRLPLDNLLSAEASGTEPFYHFQGAPYSVEDAVNDMKAVWSKLHADLVAAGYPTLYYNQTPRGRQLDAMSIADWINESVPGGMGSRFGRLLDVAYNIEYGAETDRQSALNLLYLLGYSGPGKLRLFGPSNEKYHVRGGNDQIVAGLSSVLGDRLVTGTSLAALRSNAGGTVTLTFDGGRRTFDVTADKVVLAIPFSILNQVVDLRYAGFSDLKMTAIRELEMGANSKLNVQFSTRVWRARGNNGDSYSDTGYQATWEVSRAQPGTSGILVDYTGGNYARTFGQGTSSTKARQFLKQIEPVVPGVTAAWNGLATVDYWPGNAFTRGSYSFWKVGQYTRFAGVEGEREGNTHFCGEHTSIDSQGYLEGAVESGERAAAEVAATL